MLVEILKTKVAITVASKYIKLVALNDEIVKCKDASSRIIKRIRSISLRKMVADSIWKKRMNINRNDQKILNIFCYYSNIF
jgi:hypothetical protein